MTNDQNGHPISTPSTSENGAVNGRADRIRLIRESNSYRQSHVDPDFMNRDELRPVRLQLELLKPELIMEEEGVPKVVFAAAILSAMKTPEMARRVLEKADVDAETAGIVLGLVRGKNVEGAENERQLVMDAVVLEELVESLGSKKTKAKVDPKAIKKKLGTKAARRRVTKLVADAS